MRNFRIRNTLQYLLIEFYKNLIQKMIFQHYSYLYVQLILHILLEDHINQSQCVTNEVSKINSYFVHKIMCKIKELLRALLN